MESINEIKFYRTGDNYGFLSNFSKSYIYLDSRTWPTVEHYFQASKFEDVQTVNRISELLSPMQAANEGRSSNNLIRKDWNLVRDTYMLNALKAKFFQNPELGYKLRQTGNATLIEHTVNDNYWGDNGDGTGENRLGLLLMEVRNLLVNMSIDEKTVLPPWIAFPGINSLDLFWRMGIGENYLDKLYDYLKDSDEDQYRRSFPENMDWQKFYAE